MFFLNPIYMTLYMPRHCRDQRLAFSHSSRKCGHNPIILREGFNSPHQERVHHSLKNSVNNDFSRQIGKGVFPPSLAPLCPPRGALVSLSSPSALSNRTLWWDVDVSITAVIIFVLPASNKVLSLVFRRFSSVTIKPRLFVLNVSVFIYTCSILP